MQENYTLYKQMWISGEAPHKRVKISTAECEKMLTGGGYLVRQTYDFDCDEETSFWFVIKDKFRGLETLSSKTRNQVRKALKTYDYKRVDAETMKSLGYAIAAAAIESYKVKADFISEESWNSRIDSEVRSGISDFWMAFEKETGNPVALAINRIEDGYCNYSTMKADPKYMHNSTYPYYGLIYEMDNYYLNTLGLLYVCDGSRSITNHSNIQPFLIEKFGFRKAYCRMSLHYKYPFGLIVKILYPFRKLIRNHKIQSLLTMEAMARGEY